MVHNIPIVYCDGLNLKFCLLNSWPPAGGTVLGDCGTPRRWNLAGDIRSLGCALEEYRQSPVQVPVSLLPPLCREESLPLIPTAVMFQFPSP